MSEILYDPNKRQTQHELDIVASVMKEFGQMHSWRTMFSTHWEEVAELVLPTSRNTFFFGAYNTPGAKKTSRQVDATGMMALSRFAAILDSLLTPRNMMWHQLSASNPDVQKDRQVKLWFEDTTRRLFKARYAPLANFSSQNQQNFQSLGAFGNAAMFIDELDGTQFGNAIGLRYRAMPIGEIFFAENHQGIVDRFIRWFRLTATQAHQKFKGNIPEQLQAAYDQKSNALFDFYHCVRPRTDDYDPQRLDAKGKPWASYYVCVQGQCLMSEGGYNSFPAPISRYDQAPGEVYGRGPAMMVLPALKTLNAEKRIFLKAGHRAADPVLLTGDDGIVDFSLRPGALNKGGMNPDGKRMIDILPTGDIQITKEMMDEERSLINDAFLVTLFQILTETPTMTATEVIERTNEKGILMAPTVGRQQSEYLGPMIDRELDLMSELGLLAPMPGLLIEARGEYQTVYTSPLSRAQRAQEAAGFIRTVETAKELVAITQDQSLLDRFDFDTALPEIAEIQSTPERWMATDQQVASKRKARAIMQAKQQQIQAAPAAAAMMKAETDAQVKGTVLKPGQGVSNGGQ